MLQFTQYYLLNTAKYKTNEKGQKDTVSINDIGIFEFVFKGLPNLPDLLGMDEDRLLELQNAVQEQLLKRDEERKKYYQKSSRV